MAFPMERKDLSLDDGCWGATSKFGTVTNPAVGDRVRECPGADGNVRHVCLGSGDGAGGERSSVTTDDAANVWVFVGSGRYYSKSDKTDTSIQYFVGMKDSVLNAGCNQSSGITNCMDSDLVDVSNATVCVVGVGDCGLASGTNQVSGVTGATTFTGPIGLVQSKDGWVTRLVEPANPPTKPAPYGIGERAVSSPTVFGGVVFSPTFIPTNDICVSSGTSRLWALFYKTEVPIKSRLSVRRHRRARIRS